MKTKYLKLFDQYNSGELDPQERESFERRLEEDSAFAASYREYMELIDAISDRESLELRSALKQIRKDMKSDRFSGNDFLKFNFNWLWVAALMTAIICFTLVVTMMVKDVRIRKEIASIYESSAVIEYSGLDHELKRFNQRNVNFNLVEPEDKISINRKKPVLFSWTDNSTDPLILELINWQGTIIFTTGEPVTSPYLIRKTLPAGVMAYRFRTETEAYGIGFLFFN